jgi:hypothetical protein
MKAIRLSLVAIPLMMGVALAQTAGSTAGQSQGTSGQSRTSGSQADRTGTGSQGGQSGSTTSGSQAGSTSGSQAGTTAGSQAGSAGSMSGASNKPAEMKTMTYKGVLVDLSCGGGANTASTGATTATGAGSTAAASAGQSGSATATSGSQATTTEHAAGAGASATGSANRAAGDCPVTANSSQIGMKLDNGQTVRFDLVGNQRAQDELKNNKSWNKNLTANKPLHVKVSGVLQGDKLIVSSIH